jgi:hypothetical protein
MGDLFEVFVNSMAYICALSCYGRVEHKWEAEDIDEIGK